MALAVTGKAQAQANFTKWFYDGPALQFQLAGRFFLSGGDRGTGPGQ